jgi:hypothetical protein
MSQRFRALRWGEILEHDDPRRDPRLVGNLAWPGLRPESPLRRPGQRAGGADDWDGPAWGELAADCPCAECQAQRMAATN